MTSSDEMTMKDWPDKSKATDIKTEIKDIASLLIFDEESQYYYTEDPEGMSELIFEAFQSQLSTALSEALALRVENEKMREELQFELDCHKEDSAETPVGCASQFAYRERIEAIEKALQPTSTALTDKLLRLVVAGYNYAAFNKPVRHNMGAISDPLFEAAEALTPDEVNMIEVILK